MGTWGYGDIMCRHGNMGIWGHNVSTWGHGNHETLWRHGDVMGNASHNVSTWAHKNVTWGSSWGHFMCPYMVWWNMGIIWGSLWYMEWEHGRASMGYKHGCRHGTLHRMGITHLWGHYVSTWSGNMGIWGHYVSHGGGGGSRGSGPPLFISKKIWDMGTL